MAEKAEVLPSCSPSVPSRRIKELEAPRFARAPKKNHCDLGMNMEKSYRMEAGLDWLAI